MGWISNNRSLFWTTLPELSNSQYPTNYRISYLGSLLFWNILAFSHAFRTITEQEVFLLSSENHYSVLQCTYEEESSLLMSLLFSHKVFLASPSPTYVGNESSSRIARSAEQMIKLPSVEEHGLVAGKWNAGLSRHSPTQHIAPVTAKICFWTDYKSWMFK